MLTQERNEHLIELCRELVRTPSLSGDEIEVAALIRRRMQAAGFDIVETDKYGSVVGRLKGKHPGKRILLDGHIDTVDVSDSSLWSHNPFGADLVDGKIYGRGSSDMKGSVAAMLLAIAWFGADTNRDFAGEICLSCTVHEECFEGISAREVTRRLQPDCVIVGEATGLTLKRGQRGRAEVVIETFGKACHSSNPEKGINAVYRMARIIEAMRGMPLQTHPVLGSGIYELVDIISAPYPGASVVPDRCRATYDHRLLVGETPQSVLDDIGAVVQQAQGPGPETRVSIAQDEQACWTGERLSASRFFNAWLMEEESPLVQRAQAGLRDMGIDAPLSHFSFCTNGSHFCGEAGIPTIGFGPSAEELAHTVDEYIEVEQLARACNGFYGIIRRLATPDWEL